MNCTSQRRCHGMTRDKHVHPRSPEGVHGIDECILDYGQTWSLPLSYNNFKVALVTSSAEDPVQVVFTSPQVASWTHTGLHLGLTDTGCWHKRFVVWRPRCVANTSTNWWQGFLFYVAAPRAWNRSPTDLKLLQSTDLFRRELKIFLLGSVFGHQRTDGSASWCALGLLVGALYKYLSYCHCYWWRGVVVASWSWLTNLTYAEPR